MTKHIKTTTTYLALIFTALFLVACGGGGGGGGAPGGVAPPPGSNPSDPVTINSFTVVGTSPSIAGVAPISPAINSGRFTINWNVVGNSNYIVNVALSADNVYDNADLFIGSGCGKVSVSDGCRINGTLTCTFSNANVMACSDAITTYAPQLLTTFLSGGVPKNAYIVVRACNAVFTSCPTSVVPIQIQ